MMQKRTVVAIIQARMSSTRLPGKVLADLAGRPMLMQVIDRVKRAKRIDLVALATTDRPADDPIAEACATTQAPCFRGDENDVLDRYYQAATHFRADVVVRLTADCPLLDPAVIDHVTDTFLHGDFDYVSNTIKPTYPDGLDTEVLTVAALEWAWREAKLVSEREHVTPYIWKHPQLFRLGNVAREHDVSGFRWTVDEPEDLEFVRRVYAHFGPGADFGMTDVLRLIGQHPEILDINARFRRNEGYLKSLREDRVTDIEA